MPTNINETENPFLSKTDDNSAFSAPHDNVPALSAVPKIKKIEEGLAPL